MVTVEVDENVWRYLMSQKQPGDSHNDVLRRELGLAAAGGDERSQPAETRREAGPVSRARDALADWDPVDVDSAKARRAVVAVVEWVAAQDAPQQKADVLAWAEAHPDATPYAASTLWDKVAQPGLKRLQEKGVVERTPNVGYEIVDDGDSE